MLVYNLRMEKRSPHYLTRDARRELWNIRWSGPLKDEDLVRNDSPILKEVHDVVARDLGKVGTH